MNRIESYVLIGAKNVLTLEEASTLTGYSTAHLYRLTSQREIPHYKRQKKLFFDKAELEGWMKGCRIKTNEELELESRRYL